MSKAITHGQRVQTKKTQHLAPFEGHVFSVVHPRVGTPFVVVIDDQDRAHHLYLHEVEAIQ